MLSYRESNVPLSFTLDAVDNPESVADLAQQMLHICSQNRPTTSALLKRFTDYLGNAEHHPITRDITDRLAQTLISSSTEQPSEPIIYRFHKKMEIEASGNIMGVIVNGDNSLICVVFGWNVLKFTEVHLFDLSGTPVVEPGFALRMKVREQQRRIRLRKLVVLAFAQNSQIAVAKTILKLL